MHDGKTRRMLCLSYEYSSHPLLLCLEYLQFVLDVLDSLIFYCAVGAQPTQKPKIQSLNLESNSVVEILVDFQMMFSVFKKKFLSQPSALLSAVDFFLSQRIHECFLG